MTVYYAPGGGRGHLTRARRVLERLAIPDATIVASTGTECGVTVIPPQLEGDREGHARWLASIVDRHLIVDTFPAGIQGELSAIAVDRIDYVARLLQWDAYRVAVPHPAPRFATTYVVEPLLSAHDRFVHENSAAVTPMQLRVPQPAQDANRGSYWLIVHSGPVEEVQELVAYTVELRALSPDRCEVLVATPCALDLPEGFRRIDAIPATPLYPGAEKIITAAGFNVMLETEPHRQRHLVLPFPRRFDDQFLRAARRHRAVS